MAAAREPREQGFTLIESLVAITILAMVVMHFLGTRTAAMVDATEARNWRLARELGEWKLSELQAGANEFPPENRRQYPFDEYPGFSYQVLIGENAISEVEGEMAGMAESRSDLNSDYGPERRQQWQQERDRVREAQRLGMSMYDYEQQLLEEEDEDTAPSESELEEVAIVVYFPNVRFTDDAPEFSHFMLKAKIPTMAMAGLTPDEAMQQAQARGQEFVRSNRPPGAPAAGNPIDGGGTQPPGGSGGQE